ncbi:MAG: amino acid adenylation domain-containing protein, partial [Planctomycetes bacterium]|nr:amino acid adenylation domain-containing protein [Planctomycetota bacterium]
TPAIPIAELPLLNAADRQQLLHDWNQTGTDFPREATIPQLFATQVQQNSQAVAVVCGNRQLSYGELDSWSNHLAAVLRRQGVEHHSPVALYFDRSVELIVSVLAILKAGGVYVALDPADPPARLKWLLSDSQARLLLTHSELAESLPAIDVPVLSIDRDGPSRAVAEVEPVLTEARPTDPAYVIYTSGSTGEPKGVVVPHRAIIRLVRNTNYLRFADSQRWLMLASPAFDASTLELWGPLLNGATSVIYGRRVPDFPELRRILQDERVSCAFLTAALFNSVVDADPEMLAGLETLFIGGEALSVDPVRRFRQRYPQLRLINAYGPTECTTFACTYEIPADVPETLTSIPIGRPISNTQAYVLNAHRQPAPLGVPGELYLGGEGLAVGYLQRPTLTAERFVADPFSSIPGARLYRTGDLVRWLPNGNLEFLGRLDHQVKLRGFRIELGEIETVLGQQPQIAQAVVVLREDRPGDKFLAAYLVSKEGDTIPSVPDLRRRLQDLLPEYMIPAAFVELAALPVTPNGKVDRRALPAPDAIQRGGARCVVAVPSSPLEELLAGIWENVLGLDRIDIHDNFFEIGGHSLLATQVVSRVRDVLAIELPLSTLFAAPTIASLGEQVERLRAVRSPVVTVPQIRAAPESSRRLSFAQERLWFFDQFEPQNAVYNICSTFRLRGALNTAALNQSLRDLLSRHSVLRTSFQSVNGEPELQVHDSTAFRMTVTDLRSLPPDTRDSTALRLAQTEATRPFDLAQDLMLRAQLWRLDEAEQLLSLTVHHIATDGWSLGIILRELAALYQAHATGQPVDLPELPVQYVDFAVQQRNWLQGEVLEQQLAYWKKQLAGAPALLELPTDFPRPANQTYRGSSLPVVISQELSEALLALSRREGATLFMTLLAAFQVLLARYTAQNDISVGAPIAGRNRSELEGLIGFFVNSVVLRSDLSGQPSFTELLRQVRQTTLAAYAHQDLPFEKLVAELHPQRNLSHSPLFQVMFALQNTPSAPFALPGLQIAAVPLEATCAKFDLTLSLTEQDNTCRGTLNYNADLFAPTRMARLIGHYLVLLEGIVADPTRAISQLPLLTAAESQQLLIDGNQTTVDDCRDTCVHDLFAAQAQRTPDAIAIVCQKQTLTYGDLERQANQLAQYLVSRGVGPQVLVGVCVERSPQMVVTLLAILKAGAAYVPLDPGYPAERIRTVIASSQPRLVLTQSDLISRLGLDPATAIDLQALAATIEREPAHAPLVTMRAEDLAYVIFTSGSTGQPKGVQIPHRAVVNLLRSMADRPGLDAQDVLLAVTTIAFDIAVLELFLPLAVGARIVLATRDDASDGERLRTLLESSGITVMQATPATWRLLLAVGWLGSHRLKVLCGGEALPRDLADALLTHANSVWNMYGPTETTVWSAVTPVTRSAGPVTIGPPIANTTLYVLDPHRQPVPVGIPGELYIGGEGLAVGYL